MSLSIVIDFLLFLNDNEQLTQLGSYILQCRFCRFLVLLTKKKYQLPKLFCCYSVFRSFVLSCFMYIEIIKYI